MPSERVLIVGAGVAGSILAFWLAKYDYEVVVIERSTVDQKLGQGIEIEQPALQVVQAMGIMDKLKENRTTETGFKLVDSKDRIWAQFEAGAMSPTGELELMRGDLTEVLYKAADESPHVTYHFQTTIKSLRQTSDKVIVDTENRSDNSQNTEEFDFVIGADGARSRTRQLIMGSPEELGCFKPVGAHVAYFSIPKADQDWPYSRLCNFSDRRVVWTRPTGKNSNETSVYLIHVKGNVPIWQEANAGGDRQKQKEAIAQVYSGAGWETPRVIDGMMKAKNFYSDELMQVKLKTWSQGRVALVGDSAWAPTPFTGEGNQLAIIGAWVLAQELSRNRSPVAFRQYENRLRDYVEEKQKIPLGGYAPSLCAPQTSLGIFIFRSCLLLISVVSRLVSWANLSIFSSEEQKSEFDLQIGKS